MRTLSEVSPTQQPEKVGALIPIVTIGGLAVLGYFGYKAWEKKNSQAAIDESNKNALQSELNIRKSKAKLTEIENRAFVNGKNASGKVVTTNITDQAKKIINAMYLKTTDKNGLDTYLRRAPKDINSAVIEQVFFDTPLNSIAKLYRIYGIYTNQNFKTDTLRLPRMTQAKLEGINKAAFKFFPDSFKNK